MRIPNKEMINLPFEIKKVSCTGCLACMNACPKHIISTIENKEGFYEPSYKAKDCIRCGRCESACSAHESKQKDQDFYDGLIYVARSKSKGIRKSASGGAFYELALYFLQREGKVCGAVYDDSFKVVHRIIDSTNALEALQNSKYVQSYAGFIYKEIEELLINGNLVLFSGTPCQVAALKKYLGKDYSGLLTVEILCHGVPSPKLFRLELENFQNRFNTQLKSIRFRSRGKFTKSFYYLIYEDSNGKKYIFNENENYYYKAFFDSVSLRESCYNCKFVGTKRYADITIGDSKNDLKDYIPMTNSFVLVNSDKGRLYWEKLLEDKVFDYAVVGIESEISSNHSLSESSKRPSERDAFYDGMNADKYEHLRKQHCVVQKWWSYFRYCYKLRLPSIKAVIRKILIK